MNYREDSLAVEINKNLRRHEDPIRLMVIGKWEGILIKVALEEKGRRTWFNNETVDQFDLNILLIRGGPTPVLVARKVPSFLCLRSYLGSLKSPKRQPNLAAAILFFYNSYGYNLLCVYFSSLFVLWVGEWQMEKRSNDLYAVAQECLIKKLGPHRIGNLLLTSVSKPLLFTN
jgi:hypothetical protein